MEVWSLGLMAEISWSVCWSRKGVKVLLLLGIFFQVPPSFMQPLFPPSLPVQMEVDPPAWSFLPLSEAELSPFFSNSSPFSFSQSLFMVPPSDWGPRPGLQVSFGPYSVSQLLSQSVLPLSPLLSASLLSDHVEVERDEDGQRTFRVRTLFHKQGETRTRRTCITLHAFRETEEHKASCITQPPLGLCTVTLTLPTDWFEDQHSNQSHLDLETWHSKVQPHLRVQKREQRRRRHQHTDTVHRLHQTAPSLRYQVSGGGDTHGDVLRYQRLPMRNQVQLYYSSSSSSEAVADLLTPGCVEVTAALSQRKLVHIKAVTLKEKEEEEESRTSGKKATCLNRHEGEELNLDSQVVIRYHRGPTLTGQPIRVSVNLRANFSSEFVVIRMKVKKSLVSMVAQRTLTSDLWAVTLERSQSSKHDMVSIFCHKRHTEHIHDPSLLQQVVCLSVQGLRQSFSVAMTVSARWWVEYSGRSNPPSPHGAAVSSFSFADRHIFSITPITESNRIINTAILTNQPVSLPVIVLAVNPGGKVSDVTSAVLCRSTNEDTIKVSSDCSTLFVDGSESGLGSTCAVVEFHLGELRGSVSVEVWAPSVPLQVSLADPILNAIDGWNHLTKNRCGPVYQRSSVQVLTQFTAQDSQGKTTHLLGSSDWFVEVTELVRDWLRVEDPGVASLGAQNDLIGLQPGRTSLHVVSEQWDGVLGRCDVTVTSDPVTPGDLSVQVVSGLGMSVTSSTSHPSVITATVTASNILYNHHQEASVSVWLQFSDGTASPLSSFSDLSFFLSLSSLAETVVVVTPGPNQRILAQGDGGGPLLRAELLVSTCVEQPITSNSISEGSRDWTNSADGARRLAGGSGWIRVNLDLGFLQPVGEKDEEGHFELDISDTLVDSGSNVYASNFHEEESENVSSDYDDKHSGKRTDRNWKKVGNSGMLSQNNLERAVLMSSQEEGSVYFYPSQEKEGDRRWGEEEGQEAGELEVGVGAVLALLCLAGVLSLANCLPCALQDRRRTMMEEDREGGAKEVEKRRKKEGASDEGEEREGEDEKNEQQEVTNQDNVKEVHNIC